MAKTTLYGWQVACLFALLLPASVAAQIGRAAGVAPAADYEALLTEVLHTAVTDDGLVRYDLLRGRLRRPFLRVLRTVETFDATALPSHNARLAFWMNAYNVQMLYHLVETPGVENIVDDGVADAFFRTPVHTAGLGVTLDEIENVILRGEDGRDALAPYRLGRLDPRLHVGLNCAALSCPRLRQRAFTAATVDAELDAAMRDFTAHPRHFRVEADAVVLSSLLDWYGADFDRPGLPAGDLLLRYMPETRPGYDRLKQVLAGRTAAEIKALPGVRFAYLWTVNRAP